MAFCKQNLLNMKLLILVCFSYFGKMGPYWNLTVFLFKKQKLGPYVGGSC